MTRTILILADGLPAGGTERQIVELLKGLKPHKEFRTALGILVKGGEREQEAVQFADLVLPIRQHRQLDITMAYSLVALIKKHRIDLVHSFGSVSDFCGVVAARIVGIPLINGSIRSARPRLNMRDRVSKMCLNFADAIVANSQAGLGAFGVMSRENAFVIRNGIDFARFSPSVQQTGSEKSICMVGNFTRKKDQASLIKALPLVQKDFPGVKLLLIGRGKNLTKCKKLVYDMQLSQQVAFNEDCNHPERVLDRCSIGVLLSPGGEGISNVILEYMAMGLPVLATDCGGNRETVEDGVTGILVPDHQPDTLARGLCFLLASDERAKEMGNRGRIRVRSDFSLDKMINEYRRLYNRLLAS